MSNKDLSIKSELGIIPEFTDEYSFLSNEYQFETNLGGRTYQSLEHAYHSEKSNDPSWKDYCSKKTTKIKDLRKACLAIVFRNDWNKIKLDLMAYLLLQKFVENEDMKQRLIDTSPKILLNGNFNGDKYWGFCLKEERGENMIGNMLMQIRNKETVK